MTTKDEALLGQLKQKETRQARLEDMSDADLRKLHSLLLSGEVHKRWDKSIREECLDALLEQMRKRNLS